MAKEANYRDRFLQLLNGVPKHARKIILKNRSKKTLFLLELSKKPIKEQERFLRSLTAAQREAIWSSWEWLARPSQRSPQGLWDTWLLLAGRGFGKSYCAKQWLAREVFDNPGAYQFWSRTDRYVKRDVATGSDSLLKMIGEKNIKRADVRDLIWELNNGSVIYGASGEKPDGVRGTSLTGAVMDELAFYAHPTECLELCDFALRKGFGRKIITTTPSLKAVHLLRSIITDPNTVVTKGTSWENLENLEGSIKNKLIKADGTLLANMEIYADLLTLEGKMFQQQWIQRSNIDYHEMDTIVVSWDPAISSDHNEDGIVVCGKIGEIGYLLDDVSCKGTPETISRVVVDTYKKYKANYVVVEKNQGGDYLPFAIKVIDKNVPVKLVTATRGKAIRAEPISQMYEKGLIKHCNYFRKLEEQMTSFDPDQKRDPAKSPDRLDALVWGFTSLFDTENVPVGEFRDLEGFENIGDLW